MSASFFEKIMESMDGSIMVERNRRTRSDDDETERLRSVIQKQDAMLRKLAEAPKAIGQVISVNREDERALVQAGGSIIEIAHGADAEVGDIVALTPQTMQIMQVIQRGAALGNIGAVRAVSKRGVEVEVDGHVRSLMPFGKKLKAGDKVVVDNTYSAVLSVLPKETKLAFETSSVSVKWSDVGGNDEAKEALRDAIETPWLHREMFEAYGMTPSKGVLLYGPPGCGKTMLAKAAATSLSGTHGRADGFVYVKGPELLSKWVGESESNIRNIFSAAREHKARHGYPALVFIDEADAILSSRGGSIQSGMSETVVPQFLAEMDGLEDSGAFVMLATNRPDSLDPAITRDGRIDRKVRVSRPSKGESVEIAKLHLSNKPLCANMGVPEAAQIIAEQIFCDKRMLLDSQGIRLWLRDQVSGAMIANVVQQAAMAAMRRDMDTKKRKAISGIGAADIERAADIIQAGAAGMDLREVFREQQRSA